MAIGIAFWPAGSTPVVDPFKQTFYINNNNAGAAFAAGDGGPGRYKIYLNQPAAANTGLSIAFIITSSLGANLTFLLKVCNAAGDVIRSNAGTISSGYWANLGVATTKWTDVGTDGYIDLTLSKNGTSVFNACTFEWNI